MTGDGIKRRYPSMPGLCCGVPLQAFWPGVIFIIAAEILLLQCWSCLWQNCFMIYVKIPKLPNFWQFGKTRNLLKIITRVIGGGWRHWVSKPVTVAGRPSRRKLTNTEQILHKYWPNTGQILSKYWTNTAQILDKYWRNAEQILTNNNNYWSNTAWQILINSVATIITNIVR